MYVCMYVCLYVCMYVNIYLIYLSSFASPKDTWPKMEKSGLMMELAENKEGYVLHAYSHTVS